MTSDFVGATFASLAVALLASGCGGDDSKSNRTTVPAAARSACRASTTDQATGLPESFPSPSELKVIRVRRDGPTIVIDAYWPAGLDEAYAELKDHIEQAENEVLFTENEHTDAEISYKSGDRSGQVALRADCTEDDTTRVHITNRPG